MKVWDEGADFRQLVIDDPDISRTLAREEIEALFDARDKLRHVPEIFKRVFED